MTAHEAGSIIIPDFSKPAASAPDPTRVEPRDPAFESTIDFALSEIGKRADRNGVIVAFRASLAPFASLDRALSAAACPWFGVDLDPVAMLADEWDADAIFSKLGAQIRHIRGRDGVRGGGNRVQPTVIGKGGVDWRALRSSLDAADYDGFLTIDTTDLPARAESARAGLDYLGKL